MRSNIIYKNLLKLKINAYIFIILTFLFGFVALSSAQNVMAANYNISGSISNSSGTPIEGATVNVKNANTNSLAGSTTSDNAGNYIVNVPESAYYVQVIPPAGSNYSSAVASSRTISTNTVINFVLTPVGTATLSGHVYDPFGNPVANQVVSLVSAGGIRTSTTTDSQGNYSIVVSPATYTFAVRGVNNPASISVPQSYDLNAPGFLLTQSTNLDVTIPSKKVILHVKDSFGVPQKDVVISNRINNGQGSGSNLPISSGITNVSGQSEYGVNGPGPKTDESGNVILWLLPNNTTNPYTFIATPPSESSLQQTTLAGVNIANDTTVTITMQQPVTLSGHVYDLFGNSVADQVVSLVSTGGVRNRVTTDANGMYSLKVAPATYTLSVNGTNNPASFNVPQTYGVSVSEYSLIQDTNLDITIPAKKVTVHVQNQSGNSIDGITISNRINNGQGTASNLSLGGGITNAGGQAYYGISSSGPVTDSAGNVSLWLFPNNINNPYTFIATPPSGSNLQQTTLAGVNIAGETTVTITMQQPVTLTGHVFDPLGNSVSNQQVSLVSAGGTRTSATTDAAGAYSITVAPATYTFAVRGVNNPASVNVPQSYDLNAPGYSLMQDTNLDITIPAKKVVLHVQDSLGSPVPNIVISNRINNGQGSGSNLPVGSGISNVSGQSEYGVNGPGPKTDEAGNVTLWLFPNNTTNPYTFIATPPSGSPYLQFTLTGINVTGNQTEVISLQYNHAAPVTAIDLATQHTDGTYSDPTTVTLSAMADAGYSVANTYYKVDGGVQQTYSGPFTVSGEGEHVVSYWSVDNSGVQEAVKSKTFTIYVNQAPYVDPLSPVTVSEGATFAAGGSFTDDDSDAWTGTVDYGDGSAVESLRVSGKTFSLSHVYQENGTYTVSVTVKDNQQSSGTTKFTVTVSNVVPVVSAITASINPVQVGMQTSAQALVTDAGVLDTHTALWHWGDGLSSVGTITNGTVSGAHTYAAAGVYEITLVVTDDDGGVGAAPAYQYLTVFDPNAGWVAGSKEVVTPDGRIDFGFQVKYQAGDMVPSGKNVEFSLPSRNIEFTSTSYQWLTVSGTKAVFKANGTLNGQPGYTILVSALDQGTGPQNGLIRFQIRNTNNNNAVVYDSQPGAAETADPTTAVSKGKIKVH